MPVSFCSAGCRACRLPGPRMKRFTGTAAAGDLRRRRGVVPQTAGVWCGHEGPGSMGRCPSRRRRPGGVFPRQPFSVVTVLPPRSCAARRWRSASWRRGLPRPPDRRAAAGVGPVRLSATRRADRARDGTARRYRRHSLGRPRIIALCSAASSRGKQGPVGAAARRRGRSAAHDPGHAQWNTPRRYPRTARCRPVIRRSPGTRMLDTGPELVRASRSSRAVVHDELTREISRMSSASLR